MNVAGLTIGEIATIFGLISSGFGVIMFLFKAIVISPLSTSIDSLQKSIENFSAQLDESKRDRVVLHQRINKLDKRVTILEERDSWEDTHRKEV
ncbi:hypothetical protein [Enterococcus rotai]|uniref:hypothetical protein n=1 Tax=Enterococcus rotai TaxID=118060 RepID=UPI0035C751AB